MNREVYYDSIKFDIENAVEEIAENPVYLTLNLCRVLAYRQEGLILSKREGGRWGLAHLPEKYSELIQRALDEYTSAGDMTFSADMAVEYAEYMIQQIIHK